MKIFIISQNNSEDLYIDVEQLPDRMRVYLKRKDGELNEFGEEYVGKLTIQFNHFNEGKDAVTAFRIDPEYRGQGWGRKMMETALQYKERVRKSIDIYYTL